MIYKFNYYLFNKLVINLLIIIWYLGVLNFLVFFYPT